MVFLNQKKTDMIYIVNSVDKSIASVNLQKLSFNHLLSTLLQPKT